MIRAVLVALFLTTSAFGQTYDIVLANGRVIDPETGRDAPRDVGIDGDRIVAVSATPLRGRTIVDVSDLVVTAGFIDLHSHGQTAENYAFKARDGVTMALELEVGANPVGAWYAQGEGGAVVNYGTASSGHIAARMTVMRDADGLPLSGDAMNRGATLAQREQILDLVRQGLAEGALGIGIGIQYAPAATREEILDLFELAAQRRVPVSS